MYAFRSFCHSIPEDSLLDLDCQQSQRASEDRFDLDRFVESQEGVYPIALAEISRGEKRGHWMWFIFPQLRGLGASSMAERYGIVSLDEARAYVDHSVLGQRLRECVEALQDLNATNALEVFGEVDAMKLRSSLTLFVLAGGGPIFEAALARWSGSMDERTVGLLSANQS